MSNTIYALTIQSQEIINKIVEADGEITADIDMMMNIHANSVAIKTDNIVYAMNAIENQIEHLKKQEDDFKAYRKKLETGLEKFESRVKSFMKNIGQEKLEGDSFTLALRKTTGKVIINDLEVLPEEYKTTKIVIDADKKKLKEALSLGIDIDGAKIEYEPTLKKSVR